MKLLYIANARIPTEKAHGVAIIRACESMRAAGAEVTLVAAKRRNHLGDDAASYYKFAIATPIERLKSLDLYGFLPNRLAYAIQSWTFHRSLWHFMHTRSRDEVVYTRDAGALELAKSGFRVVFECHHLPKRKRAFFARARLAERIVVISAALKHAFIEAGFDERAILVAPSGVSLEVFAAEVPKEEARRQVRLSDDFWAVYTGNFTTFSEDKGISDTLKALALTPDVRFAAVGGSDEDIERYKKEAQELGVMPQAHFVGGVPQRTLALYQQAADVLMMPFPDTPHYRSHMSPVKMFEYMASGRPIIATDLPTIREVLDERLAYIVPPDDPEAIAGALARVRANPSEAQGRASAAHEEVLHYSWEHRAQRVLDFIAA